MTPEERKVKIKELISKYQEPWVIEKEPHNYNDGTTEFLHLIFYRDKMRVMIGSYLTNELAELLILMQEEAKAL